MKETSNIIVGKKRMGKIKENGEKKSKKYGYFSYKRLIAALIQ